MAIRLKDWLSRATQALSPVAEQPRSEARRLVEAALNWPVASQLADPDQTIDAASLEALDALLHRRAERHEPLSRILGRREFWGLSLEIDGATLDPRPDTETLVELALDLFNGPERSPPGQVLDLGTGSGALLLALLSEYPAARGLGVDQDSDTLATAARNAARLGLVERARFEGGDWLSGVSGRFDLIVSNPPYIPTGDLAGLDRAVRDFDDPLALDGGADGLAFSARTLREAGRCLAPGGVLILELGIGQVDSVQALGRDSGWRLLSLRDDLAGIPRAMALTQP
ncbi:MAG: protein-(glutamine-N5) methyltransferase, release factor-specific [Geminicoccus sp.]|nr:protein-(glutamine-N5) methyltransferase, release factor-specific [Geminicoccus sp.]